MSSLGPVTWVAPGAASPTLAGQVRSLMRLVGPEFVPPLDVRSSPVQVGFSAEQPSCGAYVDGMLAQHCAVLGWGDLPVAAVLSARTDYEPLAGVGPCVYLSTVAAHPAARGSGLGRLLMAALLERFPAQAVVSRTWSTNTASLRLHASFGFTVRSIVSDDRGPGVDTVYLHRPASSAAVAA